MIVGAVTSMVNYSFFDLGIDITSQVNYLKYARNKRKGRLNLFLFIGQLGSQLAT